DADQLLEKRVRSRFSHRKLLFLPPSKEDLQRLLKHILLLPPDSTLPQDYIVEFNTRLLVSFSLTTILNKLTINKLRNHVYAYTFFCYPVSCGKKFLDGLQNILAGERFKDIMDKLSNSDPTINNLLRFSAVCFMDLKSGFISHENFKAALSSIQRQPKLECLKDCSILELYILVCMKRLEVKEQESYNFNAVMKGLPQICSPSLNYTSQSTEVYTSLSRHLTIIHAVYAYGSVTTDRALIYLDAVFTLQVAFEHLLQREVIVFLDNRGHSQSVEFRPVKLLLSPHELYQGLKSYRSCP
ncbi:hypothetical protein RJ639_022813, partial [Escallonia herrerae]